MTKPTILTIFGASGDLAKLKVFPGIYALAVTKRLPENFTLIGFARTKMSTDEFREIFIQSIRNKYKEAVNEEILNNLVKKVNYFAGYYDSKDNFAELREFSEQVSGEKCSECTNIKFFSVPPSVFEIIIENIAATRGSTDEDIRLVIEKPFGVDEKSAIKLYHTICSKFNEKQMFLLDHYLGKSTIQSVLELRKSNRILSAILNGSEIANIQINAIEDFGVDERIGYFGKVGIIKDFFQSHLLQLLGIVTMSIPTSNSVEHIRTEKYSVLSALEFKPELNNIITGQYESFGANNPDEVDFGTDTFVALRLFIDREEWFEVPIYLKVGKLMDKTLTQIVVEFKKFHFQEPTDVPNRLVISLRPNEEIAIQFIDSTRSGDPQFKMHYDVTCSDDVCINEHGQLLYEVMLDNQVNFLGFDEIVASWKITDKIMNYLESNKIKPKKYEDKSFGPESAKQITEQDGFEWYDL